MILKTYYYILLGGFAFASCIVLIFIDSREFFESNPQFMIWLFLFALQFTFWVTIAVPLFKELNLLKIHFMENKPEILITFFTGLFLTLIYLYFFYIIHLPEEFPIAHHRLKVWPLSCLGFIIAFLAISGIWLVHIALREIGSESHPKAKSIIYFLGLKKQLYFFLLVAGILIGLGTLTISALRYALESMNKPDVFINQEIVILYGAYFSLLIALVYIPTHISLYKTGQHIRDSIFPILPIDQDTFGNWYSQRKQMEDLLGLNITTKSITQTVLTILTPFISGLATLLK